MLARGMAAAGVAATLELDVCILGRAQPDGRVPIRVRAADGSLHRVRLLINGSFTTHSRLIDDLLTTDSPRIDHPLTTG